MASQPLSRAWPALALLAASAAALHLACVRPPLSAPSDVRADFALDTGVARSRLRVQSVGVLPGGALELAAFARDESPLPIEVSGDTAIERPSRKLARFRAGAEPGVHALRVRAGGAREEIRLHVFVLAPASELRAGALRGYEIGAYPAGELGSAAPAGFVEVTEANADTAVSPRFRLRDFLCKQDGGWPKYLVLDPRLPAKLEALLDAARAAALRANALIVMSGYRTPAYHRAIGNTTLWSRHLWGAGADVFVDDDRDGAMDDLDGSGAVDEGDAAVLLALADALDRAPREDWHVGGAGIYRATRAHGPFVHVDVRERAARW